MKVRDAQFSAAGATPDKTYIEDVFSTYLYTGNGSTQTITNGIDLAGKGGMVWIKCRNDVYNNAIADTARGISKILVTNSYSEQTEYISPKPVSAFNSNGFSIGSNTFVNANAATFASWTFRKAPKFFDVLTWTGDGVAGRQIPHSLGTTPGMVILKATSGGAANWYVYHRGSAPNEGFLNDTAAFSNYGSFGTQTSSNLVLGSNYFNTNNTGATYVAYLFAHDTTTDGLIQCGSFTTGASYTQVDVNLGWEPQYLLIKPSSGTGNWYIADSMRGMPGGNNFTQQALKPNLSSAEGGATVGSPTATGFSFNYGSLNTTYIYMAIRRGPMRTPTDATKVYNPVLHTGTTGATSVTTAGFPPDFLTKISRNGYGHPVFCDRLRGEALLSTDLTTQEGVSPNNGVGPVFTMNGYTTSSGNTNFNYGGSTDIHHFIRRAPGFFDVVCYTGTGVARTVNHNLGVAPELMIFKQRSQVGFWRVWHSSFPATHTVYLNSTSAVNDEGGNMSSTLPTNTSFSLAGGYETNNTGATFLAYLFASCPGVSKVGSYTGNGSSQTINCGFTNGARFVMIKRTDSTGDWYVWDTARGIVAATDPHLSLNTTDAEVTTDDTIDPDSTGFIVNQVTATNVNVTSATYIYLAIA